MIANACMDDAGAIDFVNRALGYFHAADDVLDEKTTAEFKIRTMVAGQDLFCHPFFLRHAYALNAVIRGCINTYADAVAWEKSPDPVRAAWADRGRHCGLDLITAVADITGGWDHRRRVSLEIRGYNLAVAAKEKELK